MALIVACVGGSGSLGEFGDDGVSQQSSVQTGSSGASSSGRTSSSTSTSTSTSSGVSSTTSSGVTSTSSGTTTSSGASSGTTTSSGGSSGSTTIVCGSTTCSATTQYCIKPCCPTFPDCYAKPDGSVCDTGYTQGTCADVSGTACVQTCAGGSTNYCSSSTTLPTLVGRSCTTNSTSRTVTCTCN